MKPKLIELYKRFIQSENFTVWYNQHRDSAIRLLRDNYRQTIANTDIVPLIHGRKEIEVIDLYMRINTQAVYFVYLFILLVHRLNYL